MISRRESILKLLEIASQRGATSYEISCVCRSIFLASVLFVLEKSGEIESDWDEGERSRKRRYWLKGSKPA